MGLEATHAGAAATPLSCGVCACLQAFPAPKLACGRVRTTPPKHGSCTPLCTPGRIGLIRSCGDLATHRDRLCGGTTRARAPRE
jgi:hypothetical protein